MRKVTICVDVNTPERAEVDAWLDRWRDRVGFVSENEGCGCCVDLYRVVATEDALRELPAIVFSTSEWSDSADDSNATDRR
jgi:hypothetical protein